EVEMPGAIAGGQRNGGRFIRGQRTLLLVEFPGEDPVRAQVHVQYEAARRVGLDHVRVGAVVAAEGETALRGAGRPGRANLALVGLDVGGSAEFAVCQDRPHRDGAAEVVGHQDEPPRRVDAYEGGAGTARADGVERLQSPDGALDGERTNRAFLLVAHPVRL